MPAIQDQKTPIHTTRVGTLTFALLIILSFLIDQLVSYLFVVVYHLLSLTQVKLKTNRRVAKFLCKIAFLETDPRGISKTPGGIFSPHPLTLLIHQEVKGLLESSQGGTFLTHSRIRVTLSIGRCVTTRRERG